MRRAPLQSTWCRAPAVWSRSGGTAARHGAVMLHCKRVYSQLLANAPPSSPPLTLSSSQLHPPPLPPPSPPPSLPLSFSRGGLPPPRRRHRRHAPHLLGGYRSEQAPRKALFGREQAERAVRTPGRPENHPGFPPAAPGPADQGHRPGHGEAPHRGGRQYSWGPAFARPGAASALLTGLLRFLSGAQETFSAKRSISHVGWDVMPLLLPTWGPLFDPQPPFRAPFPPSSRRLGWAWGRPRAQRNQSGAPPAARG